MWICKVVKKNAKQNIRFVYMAFELQKAVDYYGYYGPVLLFFITLILLLQNKLLLMTFVAGFFLNILVNKVAKHCIREPRPSRSFHKFTMDGNEVHIDVSGMGEEEFGMPSGHAQLVAFTTAFIHLALHNSYITIFYAITSILTMIERVKYKNHTVLQVIVGGILGLGLAYGIYQYMFGLF